MTLLFLASWLEFAGRSRCLPLHIACIGEPPSRVLELGALCGARFTTHSPLFIGGFANKLRGFEIERETDHLLLLDSDMLVLSEIHELLPFLGDNCLSVAETNGPSMVPAHIWPKIYELMEIPPPDYGVVPLDIKLDTFHSENYPHQDTYPPYYNGGIIFAPWACGLDKVWGDHLQKIYPLTKRKAKISNQPSLATAITYLRQQDWNFKLLPAEYHTRWQHVASAEVTSRQSRLMHTIGFGRWSPKGNANTTEQDIEIYFENTVSLTKKLRSHKDEQTQLQHEVSIEPKIQDCYRIYKIMKRLNSKYIQALN